MSSFASTISYLIFKIKKEKVLKYVISIFCELFIYLFILQCIRQEIDVGKVKVTFSKKRGQQSDSLLASFPLATATSSEQKVVLTAMEQLPQVTLFATLLVAQVKRHSVGRYKVKMCCLEEIN